MNIINGDMIVTPRIYDEKLHDRPMSVEEFIQVYTVEGAAKTHVKLSNRDWVDLLSDQFRISRSAAKDMLHTMLLMGSVYKKYRYLEKDDFKKPFSGRKEI